MSIKPIHKFNGGLGATLCNKCKKIITNGLTDDLYCERHGGVPNLKYKLVKIDDDFFVKYANNVNWIEWNEDGTFKKSHEDVEVGRSLVLDFNLGNFTWMTTQVISYEKSEYIIYFKTKNSEYALSI